MFETNAYTQTTNSRNREDSLVSRMVMIMARETTCSATEEYDSRRLWSEHNKNSSQHLRKKGLQLARIDKQTDENLRYFFP